MSDLSEQIRRKYNLRKQILQHRIVLPLDAALPLVGPDCAYHLYRQTGKEAARKKFEKGGSSRTPQKPL